MKAAESEWAGMVGAGFVVVQRPERNSERLGQQWPTMLPVERDADLTESHRELALDGVPVGVGWDGVQLRSTYHLCARATKSPANSSGDYW